MKRILIVFPNEWDRRQLAACRRRWADRYEVAFASPTDEDCPSEFDVLGFIEQAVGGLYGRIDGVTSSSDYPGATVAAAIATRLGLPGSSPEAVIRCSHKYYSRLRQREAAPEATPAFELVDPRTAADKPPAVGFPCFVKPVKGAYSVLARRIDGPEAWRAFLAKRSVRAFIDDYMRIFNRLVRRFTDFEFDGGYLIAEALLRGVQVTVEGYVRARDVEILGIVDSVMYPGTGSFARFDYPSRLGPALRGRLEALARRVVAAMGLVDTFFNVEMIVDKESDRIGVLEINPRLCGQFADLYEKVDGTNTYEVALALASGDPIQRRPGRGLFEVAASVPLRLFEPVRVLHAPAPAMIRAVEEEFAGTLVWSECREGQELRDFESNEDGVSCRYAVLNTGAESPEALLARAAAIEARLGFSFASL